MIPIDYSAPAHSCETCLPGGRIESLSLRLLHAQQSGKPNACTWQPVPSFVATAQGDFMRPSPVASLLVAALVLLRQPCTRNKASARLLLDRAAEYDSLSPVEREACRDLANDLDIDERHLSPVNVRLSAPLTDWGGDRRRQITGFAPKHEPEGIAA